MTETRILAPDPAGIIEAAAILNAGGLVAMPTETVYGLAANAGDDQAVAGIYAAKNRPAFNPLIVHLPDLAAVERYAVLTPAAQTLAARFWPGPLTMVLPLRAGARLSPLVTAGLSTVAIRLPAHPLAQALLRECGLPLAAPSANPSGRVSATRPDHVLAGLAGRIDAVLDGGACTVGVESTIIAMDGAAALLRPGGVPVEDIEAALGQPLLLPGDPATPKAPGQLASHYAPEAGVRLNATEARPGEVLVGFGAVKGQLALSETGDLLEAASRLFHVLREADALAGPGGAIAFAPVPEQGLGRAINDRLRRAAAPRP
ncbi:L-threonylcarbamoyladenylate synthase [Gemmobacter serpentinus]|uniref:L-threonylcarbamoyladenylate synthase n=1 Tax=Gemmobacter serpentinus TaxID=2652247 RepID=UPI00124C90FB|nr:L-threonylcarbamoyladenylate synthase [Gemmobacter serpentinus]